MKQSFCFFFIIISTILVHTTNNATTFFSLRSQGTNSANELINDALYTPANSNKKIEGNFVLTATYTSSYNFNQISASLFSPDLVRFNGRNVIKVTGSDVEKRLCTDWLADYFGLKKNFESMLSFQPQIQNMIIDFDFLGKSSCLCLPLYWRFRTQVAQTWWALTMMEHNRQEACSGPYPPGYFVDLDVQYQAIFSDVIYDGVTCANLLCHFTSFTSDQLVPYFVTPNNPAIFQPLQYGIISRHLEEKAGFPNVLLALGYNLVENNCRALAAEIRCALPSGNKPHCHYLFEPIIGNGGHTEIGVGINGHYVVANNPYRKESITLFFNAHLMHLCATTQKRSFDLHNGANSRYMIALKMGTPVTNLLAGTEDGLNLKSPIAQFQGIFTPVINLTTFDVKVKSNWQIDCSILADYQSGHFSLQLGYNYCKRCPETIQHSCTPLDSADTWTLKGDAFVYGFVVDNPIVPQENRNQPIPLSTSQHRATIHTGTNRCCGDQPVTAADKNSGVDNPAFAFFNSTTPITYEPLITSVLNTAQRTSKNPIFLGTADINFASAKTQRQSHKFFFNTGHTWKDTCHTFIPFLTIGGMIEISPTADPCTTNSLCSLSQIGLWLKGGCSF